MLTWGKYEYPHICVLCPQPDLLEWPSLNAALVQASIMEHHRLSGFWTTVLETGSLSSGCQESQVPVRALCWTANCQLFTSSPGGAQREKATSHDINLIHKELPSCLPLTLTTFQRPHLLIPSCCGAGRGFPHMHLRWGVHDSTYNKCLKLSQGFAPMGRPW